MKLNVLFPLHFTNIRISYTCNSFAKNMQSDDFDVEVTCPSKSADLNEKYLRPIFPEYVGRAFGRMNRELTARAAEEFFLMRSEAEYPAYIWADCTLSFLERLKKRSAIVFAEKFNGLAAAAKDILDAAYDEAKLKPTHGIDQKRVEYDIERIAGSDYVFVANPIAADNMKRYGIPEEKIIRSSYGFDPKRFYPRPPPPDRSEKVTFLFVGVAEVRKGINLLLKAWDKAGIDAQLLIAGPVSDEVKTLCSDVLNKDSVTQLGWVNNIEQIYSMADVFVFPTHDEGGPLVTFEAMGSGLPVIVSPMGGTTVVRDAQDGFVVDPYDLEGWAERITQLAKDAELRKTMGESAYERALKFAWKNVGASRRNDVIAKMEKKTEPDFPAQQLV